MDGRVQLPVIKYLQDRFKVQYVDTITEPGPNLILAEQMPLSCNPFFSGLKYQLRSTILKE